MKCLFTRRICNEQTTSEILIKWIIFSFVLLINVFRGCYFLCCVCFFFGGFCCCINWIFRGCRRWKGKRRFVTICKQRWQHDVHLSCLFKWKLMGSLLIIQNKTTNNGNSYFMYNIAIHIHGIIKIYTCLSLALAVYSLCLTFSSLPSKQRP